MLKRLKLINFMVIASLMLVLTFGSSERASAQGATVCPGVPFSTGWVQVISDGFIADWSAALLGTVESTGFGVVAGIDWMYTDTSVFETQLSGSQLVSWWTQAPGRNTSIQVTNTDPLLPVNIHVIIQNQNCVEVRDFCDTLTAEDTHVYDFGNLVSNLGQPIPTGNFQGQEGFVTITPVNTCPNPNQAISFNALVGNLRVIDVANDFDYGTNVQARLAVTFANGVVVADTGDTLDGLSAGFLGGDVGLLATTLSQNFSVVGGGAAAADAVFINFVDSYGPPYDAIGGFVTLTPGIFDAAENFLSCGDFFVCFARFGIDDVLVNSDDFNAPPPTPSDVPCTSDDACPDGQACVGAVAGACSVTTTTACFDDSECPDTETCEGETIGVCQDVTPPPTDSPSPTPDGDGGGGCAVAGPVGLGTAMANVILPLIPVAFAFGVAAFRRRNRK